MHLPSVTAVGFLFVAPFVHSLAISHHDKPQSITPREDDKLDEGVFLTECTRWQEGRTSNNGYKVFLELTNDVDKEGDGIVATAYPYDYGLSGPGAHIKWTVGTESQPIKGKLNGRDFTAWDLRATGDSKTGIAGRAHMGGDMRCYRVNKKKKQEIMKKPKVWYDCITRYVCMRSERWIRQTDFHVPNSTVDVTIGVTIDLKPNSPPIPVEVGEYVREAFGRLNKLYSPDNAKDQAAFPINASDSQIEFAYDLTMAKDDAYFDKTRVPTIAKQLVEKLADKVTETAKYDKCEQNWGSKYPTCYYKVQFPSRIDVKVKVAQQATQTWVPQDHVALVVRNVAKKEDKCKTNGALAKAFSGVFGVGAFFLSGGMSAAAKGLGAILGTTGAAACGEIPLIS